jgi:hypothetical protein
MKRLSHVKTLKRLSVLSQPTRLVDLGDKLEADDYTDTWLFEVEKIKTKRLRRFRQQLAA